jgi:hypothetical protein
MRNSVPDPHPFWQVAAPALPFLLNVHTRQSLALAATLALIVLGVLKPWCYSNPVC